MMYKELLLLRLYVEQEEQCSSCVCVLMYVSLYINR